jgi:RHS repeat-associated protein
VTYIVYDDVDQEERIYAGWDAVNNVPTGPTQVVRYDQAGSYTETLTMSATPHLTGGLPDGTEAISGLQTLTRDYSNSAGQVVMHDAYFNLTGLTYSTSTTLGTQGTNFYRTTYAYDERGRQNKVVSPTGTITRTVYDGLGRVVSKWVGTNDTPTSGYWSPTNPAGMTKIEDDVYDNGGVGDSTLTKMTQHPGGTAADRETDYFYDWRDRLVAMKLGVQGTEDTTTHRPIGYLDYDNLNEVTKARRFDGDGVSITSTNGVPSAPSASLLRAQTVTSYDDRGRVFQTQTYSVNPSTGAVSTYALTTNMFYDHRGNVIKTAAPGGLVTKTLYDGAGRTTKVYETDGGGDTIWSDAGNVVGDNVLTQTQVQYDANSNPILFVTKDHFHNDTATGELGTPTTGPLARVSYFASYYDAANRKTADVNVGTNGGTAWTRPNTVPSRSDTVLVNSYTYDSAGWLDTTTDPNGIVTKTLEDALNRLTKNIENYTGGSPGSTTDKTTEYTYDGSGHVLTLTSDLPGGGGETTQYVYGVTTAGGNGVTSNDLLATVQHPDKTTGVPSSSEQDTYTYNALGQVLTMTDRNGNVHTYSYDVLGRQTSDAITTLGAGVDGSVRRIETAFDTQGNAYLFTSYDAASGGNIVNQVQRSFNGLGQLTAEYQSHSGAVNTSTTPSVQYTYTEMAGGVNNSRMTSMVYPNGKVLTYTYLSGVDNAISRVSQISDSTGILEVYRYLGLGTVVKLGHPQTNVNLTYIKATGSDPNGDAGDQYIGLDRFGRVVDQRWKNSNTLAELDRYFMGYDRDSNVLYRDNNQNSAFGELYTYDGLNQLSTFQRGTLNSTKTGLIGSPSRSQSWTPDALGNFTSVTSDGNVQTRTSNMQNELTGMGSSTLTYDSNGNQTTDENGNQFVYDAWNRLVTVKNSLGVTQETLGYDAIGHRITETTGTTKDLYYSNGWQVLEERVGTLVQAQYVWSLAHADSLVLRDRDPIGTGTLSERLWVMHDANYNVTGLVNTTGTVVERYVYDPFGAVTIYDAGYTTTRAASSYNWVYLHQGLKFDSISGQYYAEHRGTSPTQMRWEEGDPLGFKAGDPNLYRMEGNNPSNHTDQSGEVVPLVAGGIVLAYLLWPSQANPIISTTTPITGNSSQQDVLDYVATHPGNANIITQTHEELQVLFDMANNTVIATQIDNCWNWTARVGSPVTQAITTNEMFYEYPIGVPGTNWWLGHAVIQVTLPDGAIFYVDNGWWGNNNHIFGPNEIPFYVTQRICPPVPVRR